MQNVDGSTYFNQNWAAFKAGFGNVTANYWIGNDRRSNLSRGDGYRHYVELQSSSNQLRFYAWYNTFTLGNASTGYQLQVAGFRGTAGDSFKNVTTSVTNGMMFTTSDVNNDVYSSGNCISNYEGGFWMNSYGENCLTGSGSFFFWNTLPPGPVLTTARMHLSRQ